MLTTLLCILIYFIAYAHGKAVERRRLALEFERARDLNLEAEKIAREIDLASRELRAAGRAIPFKLRDRKHLQ